MRWLIVVFLLAIFPSATVYGENIQGDEPFIEKQIIFNGAWLPDVSPLLVGLNNYITLINMRYTDTSIEGVSGYTPINTAALSTYTKIRNGIQLTTDYDTSSYVFVHALDSSDNGAVFYSTADIPEQGNFSATAIHTDAEGAGPGRFSLAPGGNVIYSNGVENFIWGGNESVAEGFYTCDTGNGTNPKDYSAAVKNTLSSSGNYAVVSNTQKNWLVFSARPLQSVKYTIEKSNTSASTTSANYWNGTSFIPVTNWNDGTSSGGKSLSANGTMSFASTVSGAKPFHFEGAYLYAYTFRISAASETTISHVSVDAPWQPVVDTWDRVARECSQFQAYRTSTGAYSEYTHEVNEESTVYYPKTALLGNLTSSDHVLLMFQDRASAIKWFMLGDKTNTSAATATVSYWGGRAWSPVSSLVDGTSSGGKSLNQSGLMSWMPPAEGFEFPKTEFGITGYFYKVSWSATLKNGESGDGTSVDFVTGVPAQKKVPRAKFTAMFKNRVLLCNLASEKAPNAIAFPNPNTPDVWNGALSSDGSENLLYFGGEEEITCGTQIYNRYGADILSQFIVLKEGQTYVLGGDTPEDFKIFTVSATVGCPAPLTLVSAETGFEMVTSIRRNVAIWLSNSGPMRFDGAVLSPLLGIEPYFDPTNNICINYDAIENSRAWYDATYKEYNLLIPAGASTTCNTWLVYDLIHKKWFRKNTGEARMPQFGCSVTDTSGISYIYGGVDSGTMVRLDNGNSWNGVPIEHIVETGDFFFTDDFWDETDLRYLRVVTKAVDEDAYLVVTLIKNSETSGIEESWLDTNGGAFLDTSGGAWIDGNGGITLMNFLLESELSDIVDRVEAINVRGKFYRLKFKISTSNTDKGFQPIGFGLRGRKVRKVMP